MFVAPCFGFGGLERVLIETIANLDASRFIPSFCTLLEPDPAMYKKIKQLGISCTILDKGEGFRWSLIFELAGLLKRERIDLVNSHDIGATLFAAPAAWLARIPRVIHTEHSQLLAERRHLSLYKLIMRMLVTRVITVSRDLENHLATTFSIDRSRISVIPNGIDVKRFDGVRDTRNLREELGIPETARIIGTIGRLTEQKGMEYLIRAYADCIERHPDLALVIVGSGEERENLGLLANNLGVKNGVIFAGIREDIPELLQIFEIFVLPSIWEGQPLAIMEAMAAGKSIVASNVGGNAEILRQGELGMLAEPRNAGSLANAIEMLLTDRVLSQQLGERAHTHAVAELTAALMTKRYEETFDSLFSSNHAKVAKSQ